MLTLQYIPFNEIEPLSSERRIAKILGIVKKNKIVFLQGRLRPYEETRLIERTMEEVDKEFKGIELCTIIPPHDRTQFGRQMRQKVTKLLLGDRDGMTIIGPATIIKEIKRNPDKIELWTHNRSWRR